MRDQSGLVFVIALLAFGVGAVIGGGVVDSMQYTPTPSPRLERAVATNTELSNAAVRMAERAVTAGEAWKKRALACEATPAVLTPAATVATRF